MISVIIPEGLQSFSFYISQPAFGLACFGEGDKGCVEKRGILKGIREVGDKETL
jgi:hypothetical protein